MARGQIVEREYCDYWEYIDVGTQSHVSFWFEFLSMKYCHRHEWFRQSLVKLKNQVLLRTSSLDSDFHRLRNLLLAMSHRGLVAPIAVQNKALHL